MSILNLEAPNELNILCNSITTNVPFVPPLRNPIYLYAEKDPTFFDTITSAAAYVPVAMTVVNVKEENGFATENTMKIAFVLGPGLLNINVDMSVIAPAGADYGVYDFAVFLDDNPTVPLMITSQYLDNTTQSVNLSGILYVENAVFIQVFVKSPTTGVLRCTNFNVNITQP